MRGVAVFVIDLSSAAKARFDLDQPAEVGEPDAARVGQCSDVGARELFARMDVDRCTDGSLPRDVVAHRVDVADREIDHLQSLADIHTIIGCHVVTRLDCERQLVEVPAGLPWSRSPALYRDCCLEEKPVADDVIVVDGDRHRPTRYPAVVDRPDAARRFDRESRVRDPPRPLGVVTVIVRLGGLTLSTTGDIDRVAAGTGDREVGTPCASGHGGLTPRPEIVPYGDIDEGAIVARTRHEVGRLVHIGHHERRHRVRLHVR